MILAVGREDQDELTISQPLQ